jgi:hypothetical protein
MGAGCIPFIETIIIMDGRLSKKNEVLSRLDKRRKSQMFLVARFFLPSGIYMIMHEFFNMILTPPYETSLMNSNLHHEYKLKLENQ